MPRPYGRAMGRLSWVIRRKNDRDIWMCFVSDTKQNDRDTSRAHCTGLYENGNSVCVTWVHWHDLDSDLCSSVWRCTNTFLPWRIMLSSLFTHRGKMAAIFQMSFYTEFSRMKMYKFRLWFHWILFPRGSIYNIPALVQIMAWHRPGAPLSELMMVIVLTHLCVTRPQWVN